MQLQCCVAKDHGFRIGKDPIQPAKNEKFMAKVPENRERQPVRHKFKREEKYCVLIKMSSRDQSSIEKLAQIRLPRQAADFEQILISWAKAIPHEIIDDRRPDKQSQGKPDIAHIRITEPAEQNVSQHNKHQAHIDKQSDQAGRQQPIELTEFREKYKHAEKA